MARTKSAAPTRPRSSSNATARPRPCLLRLHGSRTGTLVAPGADGLWRCRVTKHRADGSTWRSLYSLGTADKSLARRKLAASTSCLPQGVDPFGAAEAAGAPERVGEYAEAWLSAREARGISKARWERSYFKNHVVEAIGNMAFEDVKPAHVRFILEEAAEKGLKHSTVGEVRAVLHRIFDEAWRAELIESNPVARVKQAPSREIRKERCILTDEELSQFVACEQVDLELRMMAIVARCEVGMRTGYLHKWDWSMIDRVAFAECFIPRSGRHRLRRVHARPGAAQLAQDADGVTLGPVPAQSRLSCARRSAAGDAAMRALTA
jgi:hypothetical protein